MIHQTKSFQVTDNTVYLLEETGRYRRSQPELQNRFYAHVQGAPGVDPVETAKVARRFSASQELLDAVLLVLQSDLQLPDAIYDALDAAVSKATDEFNTIPHSEVFDD